MMYDVKNYVINQEYDLLLFLNYHTEYFRLHWSK